MATTPTEHAKTPPKNLFFKNKGNQEKKVEDFFFSKKPLSFFFQKDSTKLVIFLTNFTIYPKFGFSFQ